MMVTGMYVQRKNCSWFADDTQAGDKNSFFFVNLDFQVFLQ